jgi:HEAT repeat protein
MAAQVDSIDPNRVNDVLERLRRRIARLPAADFVHLAAAFARIPNSSLTTQDRSPRSELFNTLGRALREIDVTRVPSDLVAKGFEQIDETHREYYLAFVDSWIDRRRSGKDDSLDAALLPAIRALLASDNAAYRQKAARSLASFRDAALLPELIAAYYAAGTSDAIGSVVGSDRERAIGVIDRVLSEEAAKGTPRLDWLRHALAALEPKQATELFKKHWPSFRQPDARRVLIQSLAALQGAEATALLLEHYADIDTPAMRQQVVARFGKELYEPAMPVLGMALKDSDNGVRSAAQATFKLFREHREALEEYDAWMKADKDAKQTIDELVKLLASKNPEVVASAVKTLGAMKARSAYPEIIRLLDRNDAAISAAVKDAIEQLGK